MEAAFRICAESSPLSTIADLSASSVVQLLLIWVMSFIICRQISMSFSEWLDRRKDRDNEKTLPNSCNVVGRNFKLCCSGFRRNIPGRSK